jgi:hypothetical protein
MIIILLVYYIKICFEFKERYLLMIKEKSLEKGAMKAEKISTPIQ